MRSPFTDQRGPDATFSVPQRPLEPPRRYPDPAMTAGRVTRPNGGAQSSSSSHNSVSRDFFKNATAKRIYTNAVVVESIRAEYPSLHLTVVPEYNCDLTAWASAGNAGMTEIDKEKDQLRTRVYIPPATRMSGPGGLVDTIDFGKFMLDWEGKEFIVYIVSTRDGTEYFSASTEQFILSPSVEATNRLLMASGTWNSELHEEIWVFDSGYWQKSKELYQSIKNASWDDVILDESKKKTIISDVNNFFDSQDTYQRLNVPWKRGIIYYGPPGNGKTISIKAMMGMLYRRKPEIPTLYVKTLSSFAGPEYSINQIFRRARQTAPCYLVFEDLDSIVSDEVRSFFLNAVDGIQRNDGILMVGSTNHLERLDPGISKRPSRFDRKYLYDNPDQAERTMYMQYWQRKLDDTEVEMPDQMCPAIAKITKGFSFAYLQEAMIASLLIIARDEGELSERTCLECMQAHAKPSSGGTCDRETSKAFKGLYDWVWTVRQTDDEDPDLDNYVLWREIKKQVRILREGLEGDSKNRS